MTEEKSASPAESSAESSAEHAYDPHEDQKIAAELARLERKPPLYRFFRGAMYSVYMFAAFWLVGAIALAAWQGVWGEAGRALKAREGTAGAVVATPVGATMLPPGKSGNSADDGPPVTEDERKTR